jgi:endoglucanase
MSVGCCLPLAALILLFAGACSSGTVARQDGVESSDEPMSAPGPIVLANAAPLLQPGEAPEGSPVALHGQLRVEGGRLVNQAGTPVQLEGVSSMWLNWESGYSQNAPALVWMRDNWNVELIRAAMGIEPPGAYLENPSMAQSQLERVVENAIAAGVYVIIDWHDHSAHMNQAVAEQFFLDMAQTWGAYPNVLYEPYNEPDPPDDAWATIKPYHQAIYDTIRSADPDNIVIFGTPNWSQYPDQAAGDPVVGDNIMYTLHFYSCEHGAAIRNQGQAAIDAGQAVFVTEWGATTADGGLPQNGAMLCLEEAQAWHDWMAAEQISWTAWKLDACADASCFFQTGASFSGGWTADQLQGHGPFVVDRLLD